MDNLNLITALFRCVAEQEEQLSIQEKAIDDLNREISDIMAIYKDEIEEIQARDSGD